MGFTIRFSLECTLWQAVVYVMAIHMVMSLALVHTEF